MKKMYCPYCGEKLFNGVCENGCERIAEEEKEQFIEDYYNDPEIQYGLRQQDLINMYRFEK